MYLDETEWKFGALESVGVPLRWVRYINQNSLPQSLRKQRKHSLVIHRNRERRGVYVTQHVLHNRKMITDHTLELLTALLR